MLSDTPSTPLLSDNNVVFAGMLSSSSGDNERAVRFEETCVLIPEATKPSRTPRLVTKSYSLPLWRKRGFSIGSPSSPPAHDVLVEEDLDSDTPIHVHAEVEHVVMKIPVPSFRRASSSMSPSRHNGDFVLTSCMRHRSATPVSPGSPFISPPLSPPSPLAIRRHRSSSITRSDRDTGRELSTEPLRPCCPQCFAHCSLLPRMSTVDHKHDDEEEDWTHGMHFTKGALRLRRSASVEAHSGSRGRHMVGAVGKFGIDGKIAKDAGVESVRPTVGLKAVKVDEVDKKMKAPVPIPGHGAPPSTSREGVDEQTLVRSLREAIADNGSESPNSTGSSSPSQSSSSLTNGTSSSSVHNVPPSPSSGFVPNFSPRLPHIHNSTLSPEVIQEESFEDQDQDDDSGLILGSGSEGGMKNLTITDGILTTPLSARQALNYSNESDTLLPLSGISASAPSNAEGSSRIMRFDEFPSPPVPSTPPRQVTVPDYDSWPSPSPSTPGLHDRERDGLRPHRKSSSASSSTPTSGFRSFPSPASFLRAGVGALKGLSIGVGGAPGISV